MTRNDGEGSGVPRLFDDAGGRAWQVFTRPRDAGLATSANLGPEDLVFESEGEEWIVPGYGLGITAITKLTINELRALFARAVRAPDDRVRAEPNDELSFYAVDGSLVYVSDMPAYRVFRLPIDKERRYTWQPNDPRAIDIASLRHQLKESTPSDG